MKFTIFVMENKIMIDGKEYIGYAFIDEGSKCRIIAWGEKRRDLLERYLRK